MKLHIRALAALIGLLSICSAAEAKQNKPPNLILFLVDDLGYGDLATFGNETIRTPNIDSLAREGVKLTQLTSAAPICTPSRAAILTGRYPARSGMTSNIPNFRTFFSASQPGGLPLREITLPEKLKEADYATALIGKWHLGLHSRTLHKAADEPAQNGRHLPLQHGFDYFFGMPVTNVQACGAKTMYMSTMGLVMSQTTGKRVSAGFGVAALTILLAVYLGWLRRVPGFVLVALCGVGFSFFVTLVSQYTLLNPRSCVLMRNNDIIEQPVRLPGLSQRLVAEAVQFIDGNRPSEKPFFLFFSDVKVHTALFTHPDFAGRSGKGEFVDNVEEMDWTVGALVSALRERGLAEDTVLFFTSDNGPFLEEGHEAGTAGFMLDPRGNRAHLKGGKGTIWEGGVRVPGLVSWPGHIAHQVSDQVTSTMDIYSTFVRLAGLNLPADRTIDGRDLSPLLLQSAAPTARPLDAEGRQDVGAVHEHLLYYCGAKVAAVRHGHYKLVMIANDFEIERDTPVGPGEEPHRCVECCPSQVICQCDGRTFDPPLLFDLYEDPGERTPIDPSSQIYIRERQLAQDALVRHANSTARPTDSHASELEWLPRPWLQPCCNPPDCRCCRECSREEDHTHRAQWN